MIGVVIVPTGVGATIGGHAGDACPVARLFGALCDRVIVHPNVVNGSDLNEMPANALYVEGSLLDTFLCGDVKLGAPRLGGNKILLAVNPPLTQDAVNSASAARAVLGANIEVIELREPLRMVARILEDGTAGGDVYGHQALIQQVESMDFDALAIVSQIDVATETAMEYMRVGGGVNPWGGVEAIASKLIARSLLKPVAHAPTESGIFKDFKEVVDPRKAAETVSVSYVHCVLKGLHLAPRPSARGVGLDDVDFIVLPAGCTEAPWWETCQERGIEHIIVSENATEICFYSVGTSRMVQNYWEAAGVVACWQAGIAPESVRRPLGGTVVHRS